MAITTTCHFVGSLARDSLARDSLRPLIARQSLARDSLAISGLGAVLPDPSWQSLLLASAYVLIAVPLNAAVFSLLLDVRMSIFHMCRDEKLAVISSYIWSSVLSMTLSGAARS